MILKKSANNDTSDSVDIIDVQVKSLLTLGLSAKSVFLIKTRNSYNPQEFFNFL